MCLDLECDGPRKTNLLLVGYFTRVHQPIASSSEHFAYTLRNYISGFDVKTGFDADYMQALQKRAESLTDADKFLVVTFHGISLRSSLKYLEYVDRVVGFADFAGLSSFGVNSVSVAKQTVQLMVRGRPVTKGPGGAAPSCCRLPIKISKKFSR